MKFDWRKLLLFVLFCCLLLLLLFEPNCRITDLSVIILLEVCIGNVYSGNNHNQEFSMSKQRELLARDLNATRDAYVYNYVSCCKAVYSRKANFDVIHRYRVYILPVNTSAGNTTTMFSMLFIDNKQSASCP